MTQRASYTDTQNYLTNAGAFANSQSAYGTFDQSGNVWEWNDLTGAAGPARGLRGGAWNYGDAINLASSTRHAEGPSGVRFDVGFRLASPTAAVPEPSTWAMVLAGIACGGWRIGRRPRCA